MAADAWEASKAASEAGAGLPPVGDLFGRLAKDVQASLVPHLMAGLGYAMVQLPLVILAVLVIYGGMFAGMYWGLENLSEDELGLAMMAGAMAGLSVVAVPLMILMPPLTASLYRAVYAWQARGEPLGIGAAFSTATQDLPRVYLATFTIGMVIFLGMLMCYLPGLIAAFALHFAYMRVVIHRRGVLDGIQDSWVHVADHAGWNLGVFAIGFAISFALSNIPLIGVILAVVLATSWNLHAYRAAYPEPAPIAGEEPALG